jgi:hypothetical protein
MKRVRRNRVPVVVAVVGAVDSVEAAVGAAAVVESAIAGK